MNSTDSVHAALPDAGSPAHGTCRNCDTAVHGHYCHQCGQSAHNPLKHVGHTIEEVFESFCCATPSSAASASSWST